MHFKKFLTCGEKEALCDGIGIPHANLANVARTFEILRAYLGYLVRTLDALRSSKLFRKKWRNESGCILVAGSAIKKIVFLLLLVKF